MLEHIQQNFSKPKIYEKTTAPFWQDDYISLNMLANHLNPQVDGASRNLTFIKDSVAWITEVLPPDTNKLLLDIGCGPGIYTELFANNHYQVTGVDFSERSIIYAKASASNQQLDINYLQQDYLNLDVSLTFDIITMIYCDYGALSKEDRQTLAKKIYQQLKPSGKLLLDVFSMNEYHDAKEQQLWHYTEQHGFWSKQPYLELNKCIKYPPNVLLEQISIITEQNTTLYHLWTTYFTVETLAQEFLEAGFKSYQAFNDVIGTPYDSQGATLALILEK